MAFSDIAPILAEAGITKAQVENYFENQAPPPEPNPDPPITKEKIVAVVKAFYEGGGIEEAGGIMKLAQKSKLKIHQLKAIMAEVNKCKDIWDAINNPPEEPVELPVEPE
jgi:hypothetical protein